MLDRFERFITYALLALIGVVVLLATAELAWLLVKDVFTAIAAMVVALAIGQYLVQRARRAP
jgi:hypothetical protein